MSTFYSFFKNDSFKDYLQKKFNEDKYHINIKNKISKYEELINTKKDTESIISTITNASLE